MLGVDPFDTCCAAAKEVDTAAEAACVSTASKAPMVGVVLRHTPDRSAGPLVQWMFDPITGAVPPEDDPPDDPPPNDDALFNDALSGSGGRHPTSSSEQRLTKAMLLV